MQKLFLEIIATSLDDVVRINDSEASRIELCADMAADGLSPSQELIAQVIAASRLPVRIMIRPTGRDFVFTADEYAEMLRLIAFVKTTRAEGVVLGILTPSGEIDLQRTAELVAFAAPLPVTFHRAIERVKDQAQAFKQLQSLGVQSILSSGNAKTLEEKLPLLKKLHALGAPQLIVGGGITERDIPVLAQAGILRIHLGRAVRENSSYACPVMPSRINSFVGVPCAPGPGN
jgi:copper homeostasis protein